MYCAPESFLTIETQVYLFGVSRSRWMDTTMAKPDPQALYTSLMEEAKSRFGVIESAIEGKLGVADFIACEIAFLQLRMLCEIVALACLVAHGDVTHLKCVVYTSPTKSLRNSRN